MVSKTKKKTSKKKNHQFDMDDTIIQSLAARSMMGLIPGHGPGARLPKDFDLRFDLIYSAANQTEIKFQGTSGNFRSPMEMRIRIKHDPDVERNELGYNFKTCKFTIYTNKSNDYLDKVVTDPYTKEDLPQGDMIVKSFGDIIPGALLKYFATQAEIMAIGQEEEFRKTFNPNQFEKKTTSLSKSKRTKK